MAVSWRDALIGAGAVIILSPISLSVSYYINKTLASPKLAIEYIAPVIETVQLVVDKGTSGLLFSTQQILFPLSNPYDPWREECRREVASGSVATGCVNYYRTTLPSELEDLKLERDNLEHNRTAVETWDGRRPLSLIPIQAPNLPESLEAAAADNPRQVAMALRNDVSFLDSQVLGIDTFMKKLTEFTLSPANRTGDVSFKVGVLNHGDTDAVIFPSAELLFHDTRVNLRIVNPPAQLIGGGGAATISSPPVLNVVRQHSFAEIVLNLDAATTPPSAQDAWRSLVKQKAQEQFTIELNSSAKRVSAKGWLPP